MNLPLDEIKKAFLSAYPKEGVGLILEDGSWREARNMSAQPKDHFVLSTEDSALVYSGRVKVLLHSHPDGPPWPSETDIAMQTESGVTWGISQVNVDTCADPILWGPLIPTPPLLGRPFRHGPSGSDGKGDCYAALRDWYRQERGVILPEFPRDHEWWLKGGNLYVDKFREAGFIPVHQGALGDLGLLSPGDVLLMAIHSPVPSHAAIYEGRGLIYHHLRDRLSRQEPLRRWADYTRMVVRYAGDISSR